MGKISVAVAHSLVKGACIKTWSLVLLNSMSKSKCLDLSFIDVAVQCKLTKIDVGLLWFLRRSCSFTEGFLCTKV